jgi:hypothetical protein
MKSVQAKDVPEGAILEVLRRNPGTWHTHYSYHDRAACGTIISIPDASPELAAFPMKVLHAKLTAMRDRGLIRGGSHWGGRGDWYVDHVV